MKIYRFAPFTLHLGRYELTAGKRKLALPRVAMELLILLVERRNNMIARQEIAAAIWPGYHPETVVQSINTAINRLRRTLGDDPVSPRFIETVIGKGYRFIAPVQVEGDAPVSIQTVSTPTVEQAALRQLQQWYAPAERVELTVEHVGGVMVLELRGPLALGISLKGIDEQIQAALGMPAAKVLLDLTAVPYIDSAGLGLIVHSHGLVQQGGGTMRVCGATDRVMDLLRMTRTDAYLSLDATHGESLQAFAARTL